MRLHVSPLIVAAVSLAGCTVGPNFRPPAAPSATGYLPPAETGSSPKTAGLAGGGAVATTGTSSERWWTAYGSAELDALVDRALADNPSLQASNATLRRARADLAAVRGTALPQVDANTRVEREEVNLASFGFSGGNVAGFPSSNPEFNLYSVGGGVSYDLDLFGGRRRSIEQAGAAAQAQFRQTEAAHFTIAGRVVLAAITIATIRARIANAESLIAEDQRNVDLTDRKRRGGEGTMVEVLTARSQLTADVGELPPLRQSLSEAKHMLAVLVGETPDGFVAPDFDLRTLTLPATIPVSLPSELVHRRPDILQAEADAHAATAAIGVATARLYPDITLAATLSQAAPAAGNIFRNAFRGYDIFAGLMTPIFHGGTLTAQKQAAIAQARAADATYQSVVLDAFGQVADLLTALDHDRSRIADEQQAIDVTTAALTLSRRSFEVGNSGVLDILDAERIRQRALLGLVEARAQQYRDTARLFVATAGNWTTAAN